MAGMWGWTMGVTLKQIAEIANVSRGTVDRVIHGRYGVDPKTRSRVMKVIEDIGYNPNIMAKALQGMQTSFKIGAIVPSESNPFYIEVNEGITQAARAVEPYGMEVIRLKMEEMTPAHQVARIQELQQAGVCGIMLVPIDDDAVRDCLNALPASIPVITFNCDIQGTKRFCFVGNDHVQAGRVAGQMMSIVMPGPGKVATLISQRDMSAHMERIAGFTDFFRQERGGDVEIIGPFSTYEREDAAYDLVRSLLSGIEGLTGIYVAGGGQQSAARALADSGQAGQVHMICHDLLPETIRYLKERVVDFTIAQEAYMQGYFPVMLFRDYHMFHRLPAVECFHTRIDIRSRLNLDFTDSERMATHYR